MAHFDAPLGSAVRTHGQLAVIRLDVAIVGLAGVSPYLTPIVSASEIHHPQYGRIGTIVEHREVPPDWSDDLVAEPFRLPRTESGLRPIPQHLRWIRIPLTGIPSLAYDEFQATVLLWNDHRKLKKADSAPRT
jgi:hypothetical protein